MGFKEEEIITCDAEDEELEYDDEYNKFKQESLERPNEKKLLVLYYRGHANDMSG